MTLDTDSSSFWCCLSIFGIRRSCYKFGAIKENNLSSWLMALEWYQRQNTTHKKHKTYPQPLFASHFIEFSCSYTDAWLILFYRVWLVRVGCGWEVMVLWPLRPPMRAEPRQPCKELWEPCLKVREFKSQTLRQRLFCSKKMTNNSQLSSNHFFGKKG